MSFYIRDSWPPMAVADCHRGRGSADLPPPMPGAGQAAGGKLPGSKAIEGWRALFGSGWEGTAGRGLEPGLSGARFARVWSAGPELAPGRRAAGAGCPGGEGDSGPQRVALGRVSRARAARIVWNIYIIKVFALLSIDCLTSRHDRAIWLHSVSLLYWRVEPAADVSRSDRCK